MREIKFRAWDIEQRIMFSPLQIDFELGKQLENGNKSNVHVWRYPYPNEAVNWNSDGNKIHGKDVLLMEYTGMKDKNGVEIYEGDIVESCHPIHDGGRTHINEIVFRDFCWRLNANSDKWIADIPIGLYAHKPETIVVIGNAHANPELLK